MFKHGVSDSSQPSIGAALQSRERWHDTDLALAMWFYDAEIPMNAVNSHFFQIAMSKVASMGHRYNGSSYHALRVTLLKDAKKHVELIVESYRSTWAESGCTIMGDGWTDSRGRSLINFLVYCPKGITFVKSVDASSFVSDAPTLCGLFSEIVEWVGVANVVQLVIDNGANYKVAGRLLHEKCQNICWSPCAAHCINLIMKDICDVPSIKSVIVLASTIIVFVYNHKWTLNWLRTRPNWNEIIRPGATRFATNFIAMRSLHDHKDDLQSLVISQEFKKCLKVPKGKEVKQIVLDSHFWNNSLIAVKLMAPLMRLLCICDSDEKPAMSYVYEGMLRVREGMQILFNNKRKYYKVYTDIVEARWDTMLSQNIHLVTYYLNPTFHYDRENFVQDYEVMYSIINLIEKMEGVDKTKLLQEAMTFSEQRGEFSRPMIVDASKRLRPDEWWKMFGHSIPNLRKIAIRLLSQTTSSSGCERNWSTFEWIHSKRRNRLEHQRLSDLVYVHYNLRLQDRWKNSQRSYDPIDYESIDKTEFWVVEEDEPGELPQEELEQLMEVDEHEPIYGNDAVLDSFEVGGGEDDVVELPRDGENDDENEDED